MSPESGGAGDGSSLPGALEAAVESFLARRRQGENPGVEEFAAAHPDLAGRLREVLPPMIFVETVAGSDHGAARPPERLGEFRLLREIGRGGMGVVWEAEQVPLRRRVALKVLPAVGPLDATRLERFRREAEVASRLDHPGICTVHAAGADAGVPYIAMRFVEGETLARLLDREGGAAAAPPPTLQDTGTSKRGPPEPACPPTPPDQEAVVRRAALLEEAARAVHAAHEAGVIHRDLKPGNIMVTPEGRPVILDFGLAHDDLWDLATLTRPGDVFGTPAYLAPEQIGAGSGNADRRTDVWALGVTLYECATGRRPFDAPTREGLYRAILEDDPVDPHDLNRQVPADLGTVILTALAKERDRRYQTAHDLAEDLRRMRCFEPVRVRRPGALARLLRWARRNPPRAALAAACVFLVIVLAVVSGFAGARLPVLRAAEERARREAVEQQIDNGFHLLALASHDNALREFQGILADEPDRAEALAGTVLAHLGRNDPTAALGVLDATSSMVLPPGLTSRLRMVALRESGRDAEARTVVVGPPASALEWFLAGMLELVHCKSPELTNAEKAVECFERASLLAEKARLFFHCQRAHAAGHARDRAAADRACEALELLWGDSPRARFWRAFALRNTGRPDEALDLLRRVLADHPRDAAAFGTVAAILHEKKDLPGAVAAAEAAVECDPASATLLLNLAICLRTARRHRGALDRVDAALALQPSSAEAHSLRGLTLKDLGRLADGEAACRRAVALRSRQSGFRVSLAQVLSSRGASEQALAELRAAIDFDARNADAWQSLAELHLGRGEVPEARDAVEQALRIEPGLVPAEIIRAGVLAEQGEAGEALGVLDRIVAVHPDHAVARHDRGVILLDHLSRISDAVLEFEAAVRLDPGLPSAWANLANACRRLDRWEDAIAAARKAIGLDPGMAAAWAHLGASLLGAGRSREALDALRRGREVGSPGAGWTPSYDGWLEEARRNAGLEERYEAGRAGRGAPLAGADRIAMTGLCWQSRRYLGAAELWKQALTEDPSLSAAAAKGRHRLFAARVALLAGLGEGEESGRLDAESRARWRSQALEWLREELRSAEELLDTGRVRPESVARILEAWDGEEAFSPVRDPARLPALPAAEPVAWREAWQDLEELRERVRE